MQDVNSIRFLLLDIEGTTTPIDFVYRTLFPYARHRLEEFLSRRGNEAGVRQDLAGLRAQREADLAANLKPPEWSTATPQFELSSAKNYISWLMDRDSKCSPLKSIQGKIWEEGYRQGELRGEIYPDVPPALARWRAQGRRVGIFSSGSILAQKLLFRSTDAGDLTGLFEAHFDTTIGAKRDPRSYSRIAHSLGLPASEILFISDVVRELDAAAQAGMSTAVCARDTSQAESPSEHRRVRSFAEVLP